MKGFRQAMLLEQMLKWASTMDQRTKKTPPKVWSAEEAQVLAALRRRIVKAMVLEGG